MHMAWFVKLRLLKYNENDVQPLKDSTALQKMNVNIAKSLVVFDYVGIIADIFSHSCFDFS